jgi:hypothetical protein
MMHRLIAVLTAVAITALAGQVAMARTPRPHQHLVPVAGNGSYLVYARVGTSCERGNPTLHVRTLDGGTRTLPLPRPVGWSLNPCTAQLVGHTLTIFHFTRRDKREVIYWWDLAGRRHGKTALPAGRQLSSLTPIPGGWVYSTGRARYAKRSATTLYREGTGGKVTKFGTFAPFEPGAILSGPRGLVMFDHKPDLRMRYVDYRTRRVTTLGTPANRYGYADCQAATATYVACFSVSEHEGYVSKYEQSITPLNGQATVRCRSCFDPHEVDWRAFAFTPVGPTARYADGSLHTMSPTGRMSQGPGHGAEILDSAYGKIIAGHSSGILTEQRTVEDEQTVILRP